MGWLDFSMQRNLVAAEVVGQFGPLSDTETQAFSYVRVLSSHKDPCGAVAVVKL